MIQVVARRTRLDHELKGVECFPAEDHVGAGVAAELAQLEGLEVRVFLGTDLVDVVKSNDHFFSAPPKFVEAD